MLDAMYKRYTDWWNGIDEIYRWWLQVLMGLLWLGVIGWGLATFVWEGAGLDRCEATGSISRTGDQVC